MMTKQWTDLIAILLRKVAVPVSTTGSIPRLLARNGQNVNFVKRQCFCTQLLRVRHHRQLSGVLIFKKNNFATSTQQAESAGHTDRNVDSAGQHFICHLRALPHSVTAQELVDELSKERIVVMGGEKGVHFLFNRDRPETGLQAYVELASEEDLNYATEKVPYIKRKKVDVCSSDVSKMQEDLNQWELKLPKSGAYLRLDGLPFEYTQEDVMKFFKDFDVDISPEDLTTVYRTGILFVRLPSQEVAEKVIQQNEPKRYIKDRYVETRVATATEVMINEERSRKRMTQSANRDSTRQDKSGAGVTLKNELTVFLRGLPFWVDEDRIKNFFSPLKAQAVHLCKAGDGRFNGCAYVSFSSPADVDTAMKKDRQRISSRYIEIFRKTDGW